LLELRQLLNLVQLSGEKLDDLLQLLKFLQLHRHELLQMLQLLRHDLQQRKKLLHSESRPADRRAEGSAHEWLVLRVLLERIWIDTQALDALLSATPRRELTGIRELVTKRAYCHWTSFK